MQAYRSECTDAATEEIEQERDEDTEDRLTAEDIAQMQVGIQRGLADEAAGRVKPLAQVIDEARKRHGFPDSWPNNKLPSLAIPTNRE